jgi:hypothetical protein
MMSGFALLSFSQDNLGFTSADKNKELVIATTGSIKMDRSFANTSFKTVSIDPDENASLLTLHPKGYSLC